MIALLRLGSKIFTFLLQPSNLKIQYYPFIGGSVLLKDEQRSHRSNSVRIPMEGNPGSSQHQAMQLIEEQDNYITERAETMETIESTIVELGNIFQQLATMVKEQEESVLR